MINQFVTQLATFIGEGSSAIAVAWAVTVVLMVFALWLLRWLFNWFFKANEIVANQELIIEMLEARGVGAPSPVRQQVAAPPGLNMRAPAPVPQPVRQHPIDDEFSEILNVRPHNLSQQRQSPVPPVLAPSPAPVPVPVPATQAPKAMPNLRQPAQPQPNTLPEPAVMSTTGVEPTAKVAAKTVVPIQAQPANTSVTMLGSPAARAERQMEARESMRLAAQAANSTLSKTADIPDIPTALVRTYSASKTNPLTGKRVADRTSIQSGDENGDAIPSQFQLRNRKIQ